MPESDYSSQWEHADEAWIRQAFFMPSMYPVLSETGEVVDTGPLTAGIRYREPTGRRFSTSEIKYTDTTPGGNLSVNPKPQFTRFCDPKMRGLTSNSMGMGEYYSEAFDDNQQRIHMQFGVPEYNALTTFFTRFYNDKVGLAVNKGFVGNITWAIGEAVGTILTFPFVAVDWLVDNIKRLWNGLLNKASSFYYLKPTMPMYWSAVNAMLNRISVNLGITEPGVSGQSTSEDKGIITETLGSIFNSYTGEAPVYKLTQKYSWLFLDNGAIDIYKVATRAQKLANKHHKVLSEIIEAAADAGETGDVAGAINDYFNGEHQTATIDPGTDDHISILHYLKNYYKESNIGKGVSDTESTVSADGATATLTATAEGVATASAAGVGGSNDTMPSANAYREFEGDSWFSNAEAELKDGSAFVSFAVDFEGSTSESFTNTTKTSSIADGFNSKSSEARSKVFNLAGGNFGDNVVVDAIEGFMGGITSVVRSTLDSVGMGGMAALGGAAYADIPDFWDNSTTELNKTTYTIKLASPYGNKLSILLNIFMPLSMILAGALPRSTGQRSYTSPFLCRLHSTGRNIVKLGMIDSVTIERGTGGIGWSVDGLPTAIDVTFSVVNLSKVMHFPITEMSSWAGAVGDNLRMSIIDEDTTYTDYLAAITGVSLYDQYYLVPRLRLLLAQQMAANESTFEPSTIINRLFNIGPLHYAKNLVNGGQRFF